DLPFEIYQDSSGGSAWQSSNHVNRHHKVPNAFRGYRLRSATITTRGLRSRPVVAWTIGGAHLAVAVPQFWENCPQAIEVFEGSMAVRFLPRQYADLHEIQAGEQKTYECFIAFGDDRVSETPLDWCRDRLVVGAEPAS